MAIDKKLLRNKQRIKIEVAKEHKPITLTKGILVLAGLALLFNLLLWLVPPETILGQLKVLSDKLPQWMLSVGGVQMVIDHAEFYLASSGWPITPECAVISAGLVFVVFVLVFPSTATAKRNALLFGVPLLLVANLIRWWGLLWAGDLLMWKTNFFYDYVGLVTFVLLVGLVWFVGIERSIKHEA
ncbi:exosortase/archaeosortase family protein [Malonomonas rubra DSM 5091]|uniref:Exosortase/archaeosortase family protein n=1 Tax=Malonomonas rubra DSM 5091 TaxID=1122189 RepID=A0A1M6J5H7_MALRU|nr:hypothetical protein [Malonomonas rubra]SHJ41953.1 exosortase/archaeosortase family protein [Malonomonas rubra DSM 5091]